MDITKIYIGENNVYYCSNFNSITKNIIIWTTKSFSTQEECEKEHIQRQSMRHEKIWLPIKRYSKKFRAQRYKF